MSEQKNKPLSRQTSDDKAKLFSSFHEYLKQHDGRFKVLGHAIKFYLAGTGLQYGYTNIESMKNALNDYQKNWPTYRSKGLVPNEDFIPFERDHRGINLARKKKIQENQKPKPITIEEVITKELHGFKEKAAQKDLKRKYETLLMQYNNLQSTYETLVDLKQYKPEELHIKPIIGTGESYATAIVQYSDWHVDEVVKASTVNFKNEYNPDIARRRAVKCIQNTLRIVRTLRHDIKVNDLVVQLGGDFIGGYIHPELEQTNSMSPLEGIRFAFELLYNGICFLAEHGKFDTITFICNRGNHGRTTHKMQTNDYAMNLEQNMYYDLAARFKDEPSIRFIIADSEVVYIDIYDKTNRFFHGHQVRSAGGIGGIGIPLYKQLHRWDASQQADFNFMCDKHVYSNPTPNCNLNGSLKGWDGYALKNGFVYQEPLQSLQLLDNKRGYTIRTKIICD